MSNKISDLKRKKIVGNGDFHRSSSVLHCPTVDRQSATIAFRFSMTIAKNLLMLLLTHNVAVLIPVLNSQMFLFRIAKVFTEWYIKNGSSKAYIMYV